jgi:O-antigen/teichoic acid export membrane protein
VTIVAGIVTVPIAIRYLGVEQYGLFVTVTALAGLVGWSDFGIGNGVLTLISRAGGEGDREVAVRIVSAATFVLLGIAGALALVFALVYTKIPWADALNVTSPDARAAAGPAVAVFIAFTLAAIPLGVAQRAQFGFQEGFIASMFAAAGTLAGVAGLLAAIALGASLPWLVAAVAAGPVIALALNSVWLFGHQRPWLRPRRDAWDRRVAAAVVRTGSLFLVLQVAIAVAYESDSLIIARILGVENVPVFSVSFKLFMVPAIVLAFVFTPLWPAFGDAFARLDYPWARRTLVRSVLTAVAVGVGAGVILVAFGAPIVSVWAGSDVAPSFELRVALAIWALFVCIGGALAAFLNGLNAMRFQAACAAAMMAVNVALSIVLTEAVGVPGVVWGSVIAVGTCVFLPSAVYIRRLLQRQEPGCP